MNWPKRPKLWNRSRARASIMGPEATFNPSPAAASLLGKRVVRASMYNQGQARRRLRKHTRTLNPAPAALSLLSGILKLPKFLKKPSEVRAAAVVPALVSSAVAGNLTAVKAILERSTFGVQKERNVWLQAQSQLPPALIELARKHATSIPGVDHKGPETAAQTAIERAFLAPTGVSTGGGGPSLSPQLLAAGVTAAGKVLVQAAKPSRARSTRARQVTRYDPATGDKYKVPSTSPEASQWPSRKPSAKTLAGFGGGAAAAAPVVTKAAGLAGAGAGAIAGVVIGGLAVGLLIGTGLRKLFGTAKAVRAEEAAVKGALVLRDTRAQLEAQLGRKLNATESRALFDEYAAQLPRLGFVQDARGMWHRPRSFTERLLG